MNGERLIIFILLVSLAVTLALDVTQTSAGLPVPGGIVGAISYDNGQTDEALAFVYNGWTEQDFRTLNQGNGSNQFTFAVTADMRYFSGQGTYDTSDYFRGVCEAIDSVGEGAFMVSPGDLDSPEDGTPAGVQWTITSTLGITYTWYPVVGNHEQDEYAWFRDYYDDAGYTVNSGPTGCPTTTFSFDYENAHFVVLNEYCDDAGPNETDGDVPDHLYNWLVNDLNTTDEAHIFVFGHEPAYPQPDADNGRTRHVGDSLDKYPANRNRFWDLLKAERVVAYICGHTHNYSAVKIDGVWQLDAAHARGKGDTGARSTFLMIHVDGYIVTFDVYRDDANGGPYALVHSGTLAGTRIHLPVVMRTYQAE